jgi:hypothetical protein
VITSSEIIEIRPQRDGRNYVTERHVDSVNGELRFVYLAEAGADLQAALAARAAQLDTPRETVTVVNEDGTVTVLIDLAPEQSITISFNATQRNAVNNGISTLETKLRALYSLYLKASVKEQAALLSHNPILARLVNFLNG